MTKAVYDKLVTTVNTIDTSRFVFKIQYNTNKPGLRTKIDNTDKKVPDISGLVKEQILMLRYLRLKVK